MPQRFMNVPDKGNVTLEDIQDSPLASQLGARDGDLIMPAPINAHDHGYGIRTLDFAALDDALEVWIPWLRLRPRTDPYLEALVAFSRLALNGVGGTMHCHNSLNAESLITEAGLVCKAASDVGIRLALSCPMLDFDPWAYGGGPSRLRPFMSADEWGAVEDTIPRYAPIARQLEASDRVAAENAGGLIDIQYGPIGPQWCSNALLETIAEASSNNNRRIHMHLLESPRQRAWLDRRFPNGVVRYLDDIGFLSSRLAVAHGVQLTQAECELLAERGVQLVSNPSANLRLRSGIAPAADAMRAGLKVAIGLDGTGLDDDQDLWREMRLFRLLQGGCELDDKMTAQTTLKAAIHCAAEVINSPPAIDLVCIDYKGLTQDEIFTDVDVPETLMTRMTGPYARGLIVDGSTVMKDSMLVNVDFDNACRELRAQAKADLPRLEKQLGLAKSLSDATRRYYREQMAAA
jgi:cytosine/adenosine deaminase-related metal-dependent hydrolase